jgi:DNA-binding SARP family transcriptional activator
MTSRSGSGAAFEEGHFQAALIDALTMPVALVDDSRRVVHLNAAAAQILDSIPETCCDFACDAQCLSRAALSGTAPLPRIVERDGRSWSVSAKPLLGYRLALIEFSPARASAPPEQVEMLDVQTLRTLSIRQGDRVLDGPWVDHRPGQVLKYLLSARGRVVSVDELTDALWPPTVPVAATAASVRQAVHALRRQLEPGERRHGASSFILSRRSGYALDSARVRLDVDEFERLAHHGLAAVPYPEWEAAEPSLIRAAELYTGDFLAEDRFADWVLPERDRLRRLAMQVLRALADAHLLAGERDGASERLERLAEMEPFDLETQRDLLTVMLERGRHSEAARRYEMLRYRHRQTFGQDPGFDLAELTQR